MSIRQCWDSKYLWHFHREQLKFSVSSSSSLSTVTITTLTTFTFTATCSIIMVHISSCALVQPRKWILEFISVQLWEKALQIQVEFFSRSSQYTLVVVEGQSKHQVGWLSKNNNILNKALSLRFFAKIIMHPFLSAYYLSSKLNTWLRL